MTKWFESRQVRGGSYSAVFVLVFIAILAAVNYLANQHNKTYDATEQKLYSLSDQTTRVLDGLENDVTIYFFDQQTNFGAAKDKLVRYENASSKVTVRYVDPDADPALAEQMNIRTYGTTLVEIGGNREEASTSNEEEVTNALIKLLKGAEKVACLLSGHGEANAEDSERLGFSVAQGEIEASNFETRTISLLESPEIPSECTVLVVAGPETPYLEPEISLLRDYASGGGRVLLMIDFQSSPELAGLASEWGITVKDNLVLDRSGIGQLFGGGPTTPLIAEYDPGHPITKVMGGATSLFPMTRSVVEAEDVGDWMVTELLKTTANSFATSGFTISGGELELTEDAEIDEGPINVAAAATLAVPAPAATDEPAGDEDEAANDEEALEGRVVVVGTSRFARNYSVGRGGNPDLLLNMLSWLSSDEDLISIRPKDPESTPMDLSASEMSRIFWGLVVFLPLAIVFAGVRTWWVRR